jgi:hypothetical protein
MKYLLLQPPKQEAQNCHIISATSAIGNSITYIECEDDKPLTKTHKEVCRQVTIDSNTQNVCEK